MNIKKHNSKLFKEEISIMNQVKKKYKIKHLMNYQNGRIISKNSKIQRMVKIISYTKYYTYFDLQKG